MKYKEDRRKDEEKKSRAQTDYEKHSLLAVTTGTFLPFLFTAFFSSLSPWIFGWESTARVVRDLNGRTANKSK
jgi:hypothetical protein